MDGNAVARTAKDLKDNKFPEAQPWDLSAAVQMIVDEIEGRSDITAAQVRSAAGTLVSHKHYVHARAIAHSWNNARAFDPLIAKHLAQALINIASLDEAERVLTDGLPLVRTQAANDVTSKRQIAEYEGLLGRVNKQRYVVTGDENYLVRASSLYLEPYLRDKTLNYWHGINAAALRAREERLGLGGGVSSKEIAQKVLEVVKGVYISEPKDAFAAATASEACLAMQDCDGAEFWLYRFLHHPYVRPFDIESYDRQIREIWEGNPLRGGTCADRLSTILTRHVARTERRFFVSPADIPAAQEAIANRGNDWEKNFLGEPTFSYDSIKELLGACAAVGCVTNTKGERLGTGFLVKGSALDDRLDHAPLFVTNAHVISNEVVDAIPTVEALVNFEVESAVAGKPISYAVDKLLFSSPPGKLGVCHADDSQLDVTVVRLRGLPDTAPVLNAAKMLPLVNNKTKVYVVGHPRGSGLQISLQDCRLLDIDDAERLVHYRTPTDPGSSGSPVFNGKWQVVALHHGGSLEAPRLHGSGNYEANEGIAITSIRRGFCSRP